jgi:hypothetical protein
MLHKCVKRNWCTCSSIAFEPNEDCPIHGVGDWPPRCADCGRFMKWPEPSLGSIHDWIEEYD